MSKEISAEDENLLKDSFTEFKCVCDEIVKNPSSENCTKFINTVEKTPATIFNYLFEYAIFPVQLHIYQHISKKVKLTTKVLIYLLKCMKKALSKIRIDSSTKFLEYSILLLKIVLEFENEKSIEGISEDVKYEVVECLLSLYKNVDSTILHEIYDPLKRNNCHPQAVYFCTQVARHEQLLKLRVEALKCLLVIFRIDGEEYADIDDAKLKFNIAENVAIMFPGIISTCHVIITSNLIIHHSLFIHAIQVFSRIVTLIFEFNSAVTINACDFSSKMAEIITSHKPEDRSKSLHVSPRRTEKWYAEATEKLITCTKGLIKISGSLHWKVRFELVKSAHLILVNCSSNVKAFATTLMEILIISSCDNMDQVSQPARSHLKNLLEQDTLWSHQILEFLEENLCSLLDAIISSLNAADENILLSHLNLLNGYLNILNLPRVLKSFVYLRRLINTLTKIIRFDPSSLNSFHELRIQELGVSDSCNINIQTISWKNSKYLNRQTDMAVKQICETISKKTEIESIAFYLMDIFETNIEDRKEAIYLINNIVLGSKREYSDEYFNIVKSILNIYLDPVYWSLPVDSSENDFFKSTPLTVIHSNILQICLLIEGIGNMAESLQKNFNPLLLRCLYPVIENAGSSNEFISSTGLETIKKITSCSGYSSVTELITDNVDYVTYHVSLKLRNLKDNKKVFDVLDVIILHCEKQSLTVLCDIIETLLRNSDILSDRFREGFLKVFRSFVRKLRKWFAPLFNEDMSALNESEEKHFEFLVTIDDYVNKNKKQNISSNDMLDKEIDLNDIFKTTDIDYLEPETNDEHDDEDFTPQELPQNVTEEDNEEKPIPQHIQLIVSVANRLVHVLPTKCVMDKIMILEILMDTLLLLCENENQLLPVVHKLWSPLVNRFKYDNKDFLVLRRCFELLCVMAVTARDFIRSRTLKEVLPIINDFLSLSSSDSKLKDKKSVYRMSQKYKLQHILLRELGHLSVYICLQEKELDSLLIAVTPYLSSKQPIPLQIACVDLFKIIAVDHFEFVWIHLLSVCAVENVFVSSNTFNLNTVKIHKDENSEEYRKNVTSLFRSMN